MRPNSAILCFGLIVALLGNFVIATAASAACNIKSKVRELPTGSNFNPVHYGNCQDPQDQTCTNDPQETDGSGTYGQYIEDAYNIAPGFFRDQLCKLHRIYIDTRTDPNLPLVWGLRGQVHADAEDPTDSRSRSKNIGLSIRILPDPTTKIVPVLGAQATYTAYETWVLNQLLRNLWPRGIAYSYADPASPDVAILAILAHEMGHIIWWDYRRGVGSQNCYGVYFSQFSNWPSNVINHGWHGFGVQIPNQRTADRPDLFQVIDDFQSGSPGIGIAAQHLQTIYGGEWASLFATVSVDEDFIETYKLRVLTDTSDPNSPASRKPLNKLFINIPSLNTTIDVLANLNSPTRLSGKQQWVGCIK